MNPNVRRHANQDGIENDLYNNKKLASLNTTKVKKKKKVSMRRTKYAVKL